MSWLLDFVPWQVWVALSLGVGGFALYFWWPLIFGIWDRLPTPVRVGLVGVAGAFVAYLMGRNQGRKNETERQRQRDLRAEQTRRATDAKVDSQTNDEKDAEWEKILRDR